MNEPDSEKRVLDYAAPSTRGDGVSFPGNGQARMISVSVLFVGATVLAVSRRDTEIIGILLGLLSLAALTMEYARSLRGDARLRRGQHRAGH
jgi:hypothetical protein